MAIRASLPISAPTHLSATLKIGGELDASTTYYYVIVAYDSVNITPLNESYFNYHSPLSAEGTFTTDATRKSAIIEWTNPPEHTAATRYQILLTKTSGDYTKSGGYSTLSENVGNTFLTGESGGYLISGINTGEFVIHSANLVQPLTGGINKDLGIVKIDVDDGVWLYHATYGYVYFLQAIYDALVTASLQDYCYWDGYNFVLKGWIVINGTKATVVQVRNARMTFIKGGYHENNASANVTFGLFIDDDYGAGYQYGCEFILQNSRYPFRSITGKTQWSGCKMVASNYESQLGFNAEFLTDLYYIGGAQLYHYADCSGLKDCQTQLAVRGLTNELKDLKVSIGNNWHNYDSYRLKIINNRAAAYSLNARVYATEWVTTLIGSNGMRMYVPAAGTTFSTYLYDPVFSKYSDNLPPVWYYSTNYGQLTSASFWQVQHSLILKVVDEDGNALEDVQINGVDKNGDPIVWIEHDGTFDRKITGNEYTADQYTDSNGDFDMYARFYKVNLAPDNTIASAQCENYIKTDYYPFMITLSKDGFENRSLLITETLKTRLKPIVLKTAKTKMKEITSNGINIHKVLSPELGINSKIIKF